MDEYKSTHFHLNQKNTRDVALYAAGTQDCLPTQGYGPIVRQYHVLHFVRKGKGTVEIEGSTFEVKGGEAFLIPAGTIARYWADPKDPWHYCWVNFYGVIADRYVEGLLKSSPERYHFSNMPQDWFYSCILRLLEIQDSSLASMCRTQSILYAILGKLCELLKIESLDSSRSDVIEDVKFFIDMNISENLRICEIARQFNLHQNYLIRKFTDTYGISPKQYVLDQKLRRAREMLESTDQPVNIIAESLGFADQNAFSKTFKKKFGCSPSAVRDQRKTKSPSD